MELVASVMPDTIKLQDVLLFEPSYEETNHLGFHAGPT